MIPTNKTLKEKCINKGGYVDCGLEDTLDVLMDVNIVFELPLFFFSTPDIEVTKLVLGSNNTLSEKLTKLSERLN